MKKKINRMSFDELVAAHNRAAVSRKSPSDQEHRIQCSCVRWFNYQYPELRGCLFAVPNGGARNPVTGAKLKAEGVVAGVSDLILLVPNNDFHALLIEIKTETGRQSETQKQWQKTVTAGNKYKYVICRSVDNFIREVNDFLKDK